MTTKLAALLTLAASLAFGILLHSWDMNRIERNHREALNNAVAAEQRSCKEASLLTEEESRGYQEDLAGARNELAAAKRMFRATPCVQITPIAGGYSSPAAAAGELHHTDGIDPATLLDYSGDCEQCRIQLKSCQSYIRRVWERAR